MRRTSTRMRYPTNSEYPWASVAPWRLSLWFKKTGYCIEPLLQENNLPPKFFLDALRSFTNPVRRINRGPSTYHPPEVISMIQCVLSSSHPLISSFFSRKSSPHMLNKTSSRSVLRLMMTFACTYCILCIASGSTSQRLNRVFYTASATETRNDHKSARPILLPTYRTEKKMKPVFENIGTFIEH